MKQLLEQYAAYNVWANIQMIEAINSLSEEQQHKEIESSFNSLYKTVFHVWAAEFLWWKRVQKEAHISYVVDLFNGSIIELCLAWSALDEQWLDLVNDMSEGSLNEKLSYQNMKGVAFCEEIYLILQHLFNHSTYHRGQLVTMLRQVGAQKIPNGDFIAWVRSGK